MLGDAKIRTFFHDVSILATITIFMQIYFVIAILLPSFLCETYYNQ